MKKHKKRIISSSGFGLAGRRSRSSRAKPKTTPPRPLHKKIALHPAAILALLCAGAILAGWTYRASADAPTAYDQAGSTDVVVRIINPNSSTSSVGCDTSVFQELIHVFASSPKQCPPSGLPGNYQWLWVAWPVYTVAAVTTAALWIGEQQGSVKLARLARLGHHNRRLL